MAKPAPRITPKASVSNGGQSSFKDDNRSRYPFNTSNETLPEGGTLNAPSTPKAKEPAAPKIVTEKGQSSSDYSDNPRA